ncbi:MAG TPA: hypothetical protein VIF57_07635 [Polyangia bacterium]|jgi:hypothetical protein
MDPRRSTVKGRVVEVDICEREVGFVLSVSPVSLWLGPGLAVDVLETLARALAAQQKSELAEPAETRDRRVTSVRHSGPSRN